jgi:hypothetical protein
LANNQWQLDCHRTALFSGTHLKINPKNQVAIQAKKPGCNPDFFKGHSVMKSNQAAQRRLAQSVLIVAQFPINVSFKNSLTVSPDNKATTVYLGTATITVTDMGNGEIAIEIDPPPPS